MIQANPLVATTSEEDDSAAKQRLELYSFDLLSCPSHPGFGVEVFCGRESFLQPSLLCIKCILDPEIARDIKGVNLIAIRDIITKSVEKTNYLASLQANPSPENIEQRYLEFDRKDYLKVLERHIENQMKRLDRDIEKMKESLQKLREQFVLFFSRQNQILLKQEDDIKKKMEQFVLEQDELCKASFYSVPDLLKVLATIKNYKEYERFIKLLFKRSNEPKEGIEDPLQKKIFELMDRMKAQVLQVKGMKVDTSILEEMRERLESINILDDSPSITEPQQLDPKLETIAEKLRKSDKKSDCFGYGTVTPKRSQNKSHIDSGKSSPFDFKHYHKTSSLLEILKQKFGLDNNEHSKSNGPSSSVTKNERDHLIESKSGLKDLPPTTAKGSVSQVTGTLIIGSQEGNASGSQQPSNLWYDARAPVNSMISSNNDQIIVESENSQQERSQGLPQNKREPENTAEKNATERKNSRMNIETEATTYDIEHDHGKEGQHIEEEEPRAGFLDENSPEFVINQWIDEKLNGFTVLQNTLRDELSNYSEEAFNKQTSQRWFLLPRSERDEYTDLAMSARAGIKEEMKLQDTTELSELREVANEKIKQIKKQP